MTHEYVLTLFPTSLLSSAHAYALFARTRLLNSYPFNLLLYLQTVIIANAGRHSVIANGLSTPKESQITNCSHLNHSSLKRNHNSSRTSSSISHSNNYLYLHYFFYNALAARFYSPIAHCLPCQSCLPCPIGIDRMFHLAHPPLHIVCVPVPPLCLHSRFRVPQLACSLT
jgi:hypothetical protein